MSNSKDIITIDVSVTPAILEMDFEKAKEELQHELQKFDIVVTDDTVKDAKLTATKMNKVAGAIDERRKELVAEASEPIKKFDAGMKELVTLCKDGRTRITEQVAKFEDEVRKKVSGLLDEFLTEQYEAFEIPDEFRTVTVDDLSILSNITTSGRLAKAAKDEIISRVMAQHKLRGMVNDRLLQLPTACYEYGLKSPLVREHINHFLFAEEDEYNEKLQSLMDAELARQTQAEERAGAVETKVTEASSATAKAAPPGKKRWVATAEFEIETSSKVTSDQISAQLTAKMADAGFKSLTSVRVRGV